MLEAFFVYTILHGSAFIQPNLPPQDVRFVDITAYSSTRSQCDADPFITAYNTKVRDGIIATNALKKGTKVMFPEIFGSKIFVVEDKMNRRFRSRVDIWMTSTKKAKNFGIKRKAKMVVL